MTVIEQLAVLAMIRPLAGMTVHLSIEARIALWRNMLLTELCHMPPEDRRDELEEIIEEMPRLLRASEEGMRQALIAAAKRGE